ncbi:DUF4136 domain-containing protein [Flavitalea antarctica]
MKLKYWFLLMLPALAGCYPQGPEYTDELDLVYTNYSPEFDFVSKKTYAIPDSVIKITGDVFNDPDGNGKPSFMTPAYSVPLLAQVNQNMTASGWTRVPLSANPDVVILPSTMTTTNIYYYYDWWYWDWWYSGWYPYWGWYYPYYPAYITGYRSGSIFLQMIDAKAAVGAENVPVVWSCIINGLAEGSSADLIARVQVSVDAAFAQSPYLKH